MSRLQDLPPDLRAVLSLLLGQRKDYAALAGMLAIEQRAVHDRAHAALALLAPRAARELTADQREQVGEYLLKQDDTTQRAATHAYLERSASGRAWAQALSAELAQLAHQPLPEIPAAIPASPGFEAAQSASSGISGHPPEIPADTSAAGPAQTPADPHAAGPAQIPADTSAAAPSSRRGGAIVLGVLAVVVIAAVALIVGLSSGGGSGTSSNPSASGSPTTSSTNTNTTTTGQTNATSKTGSTTSGKIHVNATLPLTPPNSSSKALGIVEVASRGSARVFLIAAEHLPPTTGFRYAAWLYNPSSNQAFLLGQGPTVGSDGKLTAAGGLPANASDYSEIVLTEEQSEKPTHPGTIVLGGTFNLG